MHFIDTHAHFYQEFYKEGIEDIMQRAIDANVTQIILPCVSSSNVPEIFEAVDRFPQNLYAMIGLHPTDVINATYCDELTRLKQYLTDPRIVAIGEIGLDLYWDKSTLPEQQIAFKTQLAWAKEYQLPLSLHVRDAYGEAFETLALFKGAGLKGVMHCFSGGIQEAHWAVKHGFALGIGGVVTFKNNKLQHIIKEVGLEHLVLETDAPFLAPVPFRGKTNESSYIPYIAEKIASIFEVSIDEVMQITTHNALQIFEKLK